MDESAERDDDASWEARSVEFAPAELEVLVKACQRYRRSLPSYLRCAQPELELVDGILKKIA